MSIQKQLMLILQKWSLSLLKVKQPQSVLKDVECTDMYSGLLAGKYLSLTTHSRSSWSASLLSLCVLAQTVGSYLLIFASKKKSTSLFWGLNV
jgi:hypothetical protein